jgi:putative ABC transport system permease protein
MSALRALARVARRDIARHRARSVLVASLILLPVAAMVAGISIFRTTQPTVEAGVIARMGRADLLAMGVSRAELTKHLPTGSVIEPITYLDAILLLPGQRPSVQIGAMSIDGLAAGMRTLVDGRLPSGTGEAAISRAIGTLAGVSIGGQLSTDDGRTFTVVGIVENPMYLADWIIQLDPSVVPEPPADLATWLVGLPPGADPIALVDAVTDPETGVQEFMLQARYYGGIQVLDGDGIGTTGYVLILGGLALVEAALIASAAFSVSIRRRQRELGLLAATGATPRQLAGSVVLEAALLGLLACIAGVVVGLAGAVALTPWLDELTQRRNPPLVVDLAGLLGPVAIGLVASLVAAIVPARTVARVSVLLALSGRRPAQARASTTFKLGLVMVGVAAVATFVGSTMRNAGMDATSIVLLLSGAVLSTLGFGACGPWLLERLERLAVRLPLAGRIAFRDTARARSRSSPIVTAILAGCAAAVALGAWQTSRDAEDRAGWRPNVYADQIEITGVEARAVGEQLLDEPGVIGGSEILLLAPSDPAIMPTYQLPDARDENDRLIDLTDSCTNCNPEAFQAYFAWLISPGTPEMLALAHAETAADELRQGRAVIITYRPLTATYLEILFQKENPAVDGGIETVRKLQLPVRVLRAEPYGTLPQVFLPDETIADLGLEVVESDADIGGNPGRTYVVQYDHTVTASDLERARAVAAASPETFVDSNSPPERPGEGFRIVTILLVLLFAVSVTGIAIALGEAESRPEQRSLLALGADPRLRRRIAAARAAVLALLAGVLAVPAGLLPIWGIFVSRGSPIAVPVIEIVGAVVALPMLAVLSAFLLSRPIPDWSAFRNVRPGE